MKERHFFYQLNLIADESSATRIDITRLDLEENIVVVVVSIGKSS